MGTAIYIRVSTERQEQDGVSLETQRQQLHAYCTFKGLDNIKEYLDVGSARTTNRDNYKRMMDDVKRGFIKDVVILKLDRLTRSIIDLNKVIEELNTLNCGLHSAVESIDSKTASGRMVINLIGTFAQWESESIAERVSINMMTNAKKGKWQSMVPFGYKLNDEQRLEICDVEAPILKEAFDMVIEGNSFSYAQKVISNKYNLNWRNNYLNRKVRTQTIIGNIERNGVITKGTHEPIITERVQQQLIQRLDENTSGRTSRTEFNDLFRRKIKCQYCDYNLALSTVKSSTGDYYFNYICNRCRDYHNRTVSVTEKRIEKALVEHMKQLTFNEFETPPKNNPTTRHKNRLKEIQDERDRIQRAWIKMLMSDDDLLKYQNELDKEETVIEDELANLDVPTITNRELNKLVITFNELFDSLTRKEKRSFVQQFIKSINIKRELVEGYKKKYDLEVTNVDFY